ncbi:MAG: hypothetical protein V4732_11645 [Pseudomonadota bacterium]|jgi:hypothetical protein
MTYYKVVISGANIFFENYDSSTPIIGFIACRLVKAQSQELAIATAKRDILVHWNQSFNADRRHGMPGLQLEHVAPFTGWKKPKTKHDYYWFSDAEHKQAQIDKFTQQKEKWWQKKFF